MIIAADLLLLPGTGNVIRGTASEGGRVHPQEEKSYHEMISLGESRHVRRETTEMNEATEMREAMRMSGTEGMAHHLHALHLLGIGIVVRSR